MLNINTTSYTPLQCLCQIILLHQSYGKFKQSVINRMQPNINVLRQRVYYRSLFWDNAYITSHFLEETFQWVTELERVSSEQKPAEVISSSEN